jgi:hypothetical protein
MDQQTAAERNRALALRVGMDTLQADGYSHARAEGVLFWNWLSAQHAAGSRAPERRPPREQAR